MDIVIHRCAGGWVFVPDIFDPGDAYFARSGRSIECRRVASQSFRNAGLSEMLDRIVSNSYLVLEDADYRRIETGLEAAAQRGIAGEASAHRPEPAMASDREYERPREE